MKMLTRLALKNNKKNKTRSILIMLVIFLSTTLLSSIALICYGSLKYQKDNVKELYGTFYGAYKGVSEEQIAEMRKRSEFTEIGKSAVCGEVESEATVSLQWMSEEVGMMTNLKEQLEEGSFPKAQNEIAGERRFFQKLGYENVKIGDEIKLSYRRSNQKKYQETTFVVSGIIRSISEELENQAYVGYVSEDFYTTHFSENARRYMAYFSLPEDLGLNSETAEIEAKELAEKCGIDAENVAMNKTYLFFVLSPDMESIMGFILIAIVVVIFSVLVIYNIFQVGIVEKIQEYGKIKALGATRGQMKALVFREGMMLSVIPTPLGILAGIGISCLFMNYWISNMAPFGAETKISAAYISVPLLLLCVLAVLATVWIALKKPMSTVKKVSPVEAFRYQGEGKRKKGIRKGYAVMSPNRMMMANLAMNKKRTVGTMFTMGLSCVLFVVAVNYTRNVDIEYAARQDLPFGQFQIDLSYSTTDTAYPENNLDSVLKENPLDAQLVKDLKSIEGVTEVKIGKQLYAHDEKGELHSIAVLDRKLFEKESKGAGVLGTVDYEKASKDNAIFNGWSHFIADTGYEIGDTVSFQLGGMQGEIPYQGELQGAFGSINGDWAITEDTYKNLGFADAEENIGTIWVDCKKSESKNVEAAIKELLENKDHYELSSFEGEVESLDSMMAIMKIMGYSFLLLIGMITFMNMANTMILNVITRKRELGVLQAVGMTNQQLNKMLRNEGLLFTLGSIVISLVVGILAGYGLFLYGKKAGLTGFDVYHFPGVEILVMIFVLAVLQIGLSFMLSRNVKKESLIDRIRY